MLSVVILADSGALSTMLAGHYVQWAWDPESPSDLLYVPTPEPTAATL